MKTRYLTIVMLGLISAHFCFAKPPHRHPPPPSSPTQQPSPVPAPPKTAPPSEQLQWFFEKHLGNILGPLEQNPPDPSDDLTRLKEGLKDISASAPERKTMFDAAVSVCDLLQQAMTERAQYKVNLDAAFVHSKDPRLGGMLVL